MTRIVAVCLSDKKGQKKRPTEGVVLRENFGGVGNAHASPE